MRTLSARILLGFAALTIAFGVITATVVVNMREVENEVQLIGNGYMQLTLRAKDLQRSEDELWNYLDKRIRDESTARVAQGTLKRLIDARDRVLKKDIEPILDGLDDLIYVDPKAIAELKPRVEELQKLVDANAPNNRAVLESPPIGATDDLDAKQQTARGAYQSLRHDELTVSQKTNELARRLDDLTKQRTRQLQENEHTVRLRTIYLGIVAVVLGMLITIWVVITR